MKRNNYAAFIYASMEIGDAGVEFVCGQSTVQYEPVFIVAFKNCEKQLLPSSGRPSFCMEQLVSHWSDFHEILYFSIFRNIVEEIQVSLKSVKNKGYFTRKRMYFFFIVCRSALLGLTYV